MHQRNNFDGLRLIAALMVLYSHQFALMGLPEPKPLGPYTLGTLGVVCFFTISGYLINQSWLSDPDLTRYGMRRALRIWPALLFNVTVLGILATIFWPDVHFVAVKFVVANAFFMRFDSYFFPGPYPQLNGPLWTIPIEVLCYLILAIMASVSKDRLRYMLGLFLLVFFLYVFPLSEANIQQMAHASGDPVLVPWLYALFAMGALYQCAASVKPWWPASCIAAIALATFDRYTLGILVAAAPILILVGQQSWPVLRDASSYGDFSYGIYLWAWPVQQALIYALGKQQPFWLMLSMTVVGTLLLAYISWHCIEKLALRHKPPRQSVTPSSKCDA